MSNPGKTRVKCLRCGVFITDLARHHSRNRCKAQHIRAFGKAARGSRLYGKYGK